MSHALRLAGRNPAGPVTAAVWSVALQATALPARPFHPPQDLPLSKLRGFGGKLGEQLEALGCTTAGQVGAIRAGSQSGVSVRIAQLYKAERAQAL